MVKGCPTNVFVLGKPRGGGGNGVTSRCEEHSGEKKGGNLQEKWHIPHPRGGLGGEKEIFDHRKRGTVEISPGNPRARRYTILGILKGLESGRGGVLLENRS